MKINNVPGTFATKALYSSFHPNGFSWKLTEDYYFSLEEVKKHFINFNIKWPVEVYDDGTVYIPDEKELD